VRITLQALGSNGDVQPLLALAVGLQQTGRHSVRFAAPDNFEALVRAYQLDFFSLGVDTQKLLDSGESKAYMESGRNTLLWFREVLRNLKPMLDVLKQRSWQSCQESDLIIISTIAIGGYHAAEKLGVPCCIAFPIPGLAPTRAYANPGGVFPPLPLGEGYNLLTHRLSGQILQLLTRRYLNRWRREALDLPPIPFGKYPYSQLHGRPVPVLGSYSTQVVPRPPDWGEHVHITGYWLLEPHPGWQPPAPLLEFLESGPPPVYVGFGSMSTRTPEQATRIILDALAQTGQRGILFTGWGGMEQADSSNHFYLSEVVPHTWLFPHMKAVVHHGGSGTTGAGLRAGVPSVLVPHMGDQPFWAQRVLELGVGPPPVPRRQLTADRLAEAIRLAMTDHGIQQRARALGEQLQTEDSSRRAIAIIEQSTN